MSAATTVGGNLGGQGPRTATATGLGGSGAESRGKRASKHKRQRHRSTKILRVREEPSTGERRRKGNRQRDMYLLSQAPEGVEMARIDSNGSEKLWIRRGGSMLQRAHPIEDGKWCDCFRPKAQGVARSISGSMRKSRIFGRVLIAGDSAVAFPFDRAFDVSAQKIHREIRKRHRGAGAIKIAARSGYEYSGFEALLESFPRTIPIAKTFCWLQADGVTTG